MAELIQTSYASEVQRTLRNWFNTYTDKPYEFTFEDLPENDAGICVASEQAPAYVARYITGGHKAEYRFRIILRVLPSDDGDMLDAVELLSSIAEWAETATPPDITGAVNELILRTSDAAIMAVYEDGTNDYSISLTLSWEVF